MLTFQPYGHRCPLNKGGRRKDSAALLFSNAFDFEDLSHEAHFSTEQSRARSPSRFSPAHVDCRRSRDFERSPCTRSQEAVGVSHASGSDRDMRGYAVIRKRPDFLAANRGKRYATPGFVLLVHDRRDDAPAKRLGITITKKVGNAVVRNRMRRRFRELAAELLPELGKAGADHILIGRDGGIERDFSLLREDMTKAFRKLAS